MTCIDEKSLNNFFDRLVGTEEQKKQFYSSIKEADEAYAREFQGSRVDDETMQIRMTL